MSIKGVPEELRFSSGVTGAGAGNPEYLFKRGNPPDS